MYCVAIFFLTCMVFIPPILLCSLHPWLHRLGLRIHRPWARTFFKAVGMPVKISGMDNLRSAGQAFFCANHFSFLDIPALCLIGPVKFIGKSSLTAIPVFGFFFRRLHIPVNRSSARSRGLSMELAGKAASQGYSIAFFPEGGIVTPLKDQPGLSPFKDGAFRLSTSTGIPVLPITLATNYKILPDLLPIRLYKQPCTIRIHPPLDPDGLSLEEMRKQTQDFISQGF